MIVQNRVGDEIFKGKCVENSLMRWINGIMSLESDDNEIYLDFYW